MYPDDAVDVDGNNLFPTAGGVVVDENESVKCVVLSMGPCATICWFVFSWNPNLSCCDFVIPNDEVDVSTSIGELGVRGGVSKTEVLPSPSTIKMIDVSYILPKQIMLCYI